LKLKKNKLKKYVKATISTNKNNWVKNSVKSVSKNIKINC